MTATSPLLLAYYGDDFTGSTDALEFLTRAGAQTALFIEPPTSEKLAHYADLQAIGIAGMTRAMAPDAMEAELRSAFSRLRALGASHVHYKVCSTFDSSPAIGSIGRAIDIGAEIFRAKFVPLLVGAPALGRYCVFGNLFARMGIGSTGEIYRLDRHPAMRNHPSTPMDESDVCLHLARQTNKRINLFNILNIALPEAEARAELEKIISDGAEIVLFDALYPEQIECIGALLDAYASREQPLFSVGSSGVEMALGACWAASGDLQPVKHWPNPGAAGPLLVASGSCSPVTEKQIAWALAHGFAEVPLDTAALAASNDVALLAQIAKAAAAEAVPHFKDGRNVIIHTSRGGSDPRIAATTEVFARRGLDRVRSTAQIFGSALGHVVRNVLEQTPAVRRALIAGGDSSSYAARALGIEAVEMIAPLAPGAPLCRAHAPDSPANGIEVNFKGGQVGAENYFGAVARGKL